MKPETSRISSKGQITIPKRVRDALRVTDGDAVVFEVREEEAIMRKLPKLDVRWLQAVGAGLSEWEDELDDEL